MPTTGSTYPGRDLPTYGALRAPGGTLESLPSEDPSQRSASVMGMLPYWDPITICLGGTKLIRTRSEDIVPREPKEDDDAYKRRIFHLTMPPFLQRLASQAAGTILRKGITLEGDPYWDEWRQDVTGDGVTLNGFARRLLTNALLYGHCSALVDYTALEPARTLADQRASGDRPYLCPIDAPQILGWRTAENRTESALTQVRLLERISEPSGTFGETVLDQIRVLNRDSWEVWRLTNDDSPHASWAIHSTGPILSLIHI